MVDRARIFHSHSARHASESIGLTVPHQAPKNIPVRLQPGHPLGSIYGLTPFRNSRKPNAKPARTLAWKRTPEPMHQTPSSTTPRRDRKSCSTEAGQKNPHASRPKPARPKPMPPALRKCCEDVRCSALISLQFARHTKNNSAPSCSGGKQ